MKNFLSILLLLAVAPIVWSANINQKAKSGIEYPHDYTVLINDAQHERLVVNCHEIIGKADNITCEFEQTLVRHIDSSPFKGMLARIQNQTNEELLTEWKSQCKDNSLMKAVNSKNPKSHEYKMIYSAMKKICVSPSRGSVVKFVRQVLEMAKLTCQIVQNTFTQNFKYDTSTKKWVHQTDIDSLPSYSMDNCGVITIAYLEKDARKGYEDWAWNYTSRGFITNKNGHLLTQKCTDLAKGNNSIEKEIKYYAAYAGQVERSQLLNCKYIDFSELF